MRSLQWAGRLLKQYFLIGRRHNLLKAMAQEHSLLQNEVFQVFRFLKLKAIWGCSFHALALEEYCCSAALVIPVQA